MPEVEAQDQNNQKTFEKLILCAPAMGALWRPLGLLHFLVCATRVLQWGSTKHQQHFKMNGFGAFWRDPFGETKMDHPDTNRVPMERGARFAFSGSVPIQRGARFWVFDVPLGGTTWPSAGVPNMYKTSVFCSHMLKISRKRLARQKRRRRTETLTIP